MGSIYTATPLISGGLSAMTLAYLYNPATNVVNVNVQRAFVHGNATSALASVGPFLYHLTRISSASGGTTIPTTSFAKQYTSDPTPGAKVGYGAGMSTPASSGDIWVGSGGTLLTISGVSPGLPNDEPFKDVSLSNIVLAPGEGIVFTTDAASFLWSHYVGFVWSEG